MASSALAEVNIFAKSSDASGASFSIGSISDDLTFNQLEYSLSGEYCIGTDDLPNHQCFAFIKSEDQSRINLIINKDSEGILRIQINPNPSVEESIVIISHDDQKGPSPIMHPVHKNKQQNQNKDESSTSSGVGEDGEEIVVDDRSFIQKNWMYIVPGLILLFMGLGAEEPPAK